MTTVIAWLIAAACIVVLIVQWFTGAYKVLSRKKEDVIKAREQLQLHREGYYKVRETPMEPQAKNMLEASGKIYRQIENSYNTTLKKPVYLLPGFIMGFRFSGKSSN